MKYLFLLLILFFSFQQTTRSENILNEFLVAKSHMPDSRFKETVIVMLSHNQEGAVGLVVNKPIETLSISKLFKGNNLHPPEKILKKEITLYWGGPVSLKTFILFIPLITQVRILYFQIRISLLHVHQTFFLI